VIAGWTDFLAAAAGAAAALAGLVFVALSINLARIIELPGVAGRAAETILLLAGALIGALVALIPGLTPPQVGIALIMVWLAAWAMPTFSLLVDIRRRQYYRLGFVVGRLIMHQLATIPMLLAGLSLRGYLGGGLNWFAASVVLSLAVALVSAWILLVEIMR
jgi:hypothetical protein